jgi:hypothetical protein
LCGYCERGPRLCVGCGQADLKGTMAWRCEPCREAWDAGASGRVRQWQEDNPEATMLIRARTRARKYGIECTIMLDDVRAAWPEDNRCPVFGIDLVRNLGRAHASPASPSLDRIDNSKGYVPGNIHVISNAANGTKRDLNAAELAAGEAGSEWQAWAVARTAGQQPRRKIRRKAA